MVMGTYPKPPVTPELGVVGGDMDLDRAGALENIERHLDDNFVADRFPVNHPPGVLVFFKRGPQRFVGSVIVRGVLRHDNLLDDRVDIVFRY